MRNVKVTALVLQGNNVLNEFDEELKLFAMTEQRIIHDTKGKSFRSIKYNLAMNTEQYEC